MATEANLVDAVRAAALRREPLVSPEHDSAVCLFNGYGEGAPGLVVELFGRSLRERAAALIGIAHPDQRDRLKAEAHDLGLW